MTRGWGIPGSIRILSETKRSLNLDFCFGVWSGKSEKIFEFSC